MPPYRLRFTAHVRDRMADRNVTREDIERVVRANFAASPDPTQNSYCLKGNARLGILKVWVVAPWPPTDPTDIVIIKSCTWEDRQ